MAEDHQEVPVVPATPSISADLPDTSMLWRRVLTFVVTISVLALVSRMSERINDTETLRKIVNWLIVFDLVVVMTYFTGATLKEWVAMVTVLRNNRAVLDAQVKRDAQTNG